MLKDIAIWEWWAYAGMLMLNDIVVGCHCVSSFIPISASHILWVQWPNRVSHGKSIHLSVSALDAYRSRVLHFQRHAHGCTTYDFTYPWFTFLTKFCSMTLLNRLLIMPLKIKAYNVKYGIRGKKTGGRNMSVNKTPVSLLLLLSAFTFAIPSS